MSFKSGVKGWGSHRWWQRRWGYRNVTLFSWRYSRHTKSNSHWLKPAILSFLGPCIHSTAFLWCSWQLRGSWLGSEVQMWVHIASADNMVLARYLSKQAGAFVEKIVL